MAGKTAIIRVRMAPSPTGPLHVGTARTALFNWLFARQHKGVFILRIEDTDRARSEKKYEEEILEGLKWLGLDWDEGPYRQSERGAIYERYLQKLLDEKKAYVCYCTKEELEAERQAMLAQGLQSKYIGHCRDLETPPKGKEPQAIRFKMPEATVEFKDLVRGTISFDASLFGDIVIAKDLKNPLYNFAVVVDDAEMKISHVIRGEDHLSNTPKQILMARALGLEEPIYAHIPLILNADRSKLSKRYAETSLLDYRSKGYLPEAMVNFLALLGWHPSGEEEIFSLEELIKAFDLKHVQKAGAIFDEKKLEWIQKKHFNRLKEDEIISAIESILKEDGIQASKEFLTNIVRLERERVKTVNEFMPIAGFFFKLPEYAPELLVWQGENPKETKRVLEMMRNIFEKMTHFTKTDIEELITPLAEEKGRGAVYWPFRAALSGLSASPNPLEIAEVLGKEETLRRIDTALKKLKEIE